MSDTASAATPAPAPGGHVAVEGDGFTVTSNSESKESMEKVLAEDKEEHAEGEEDDEPDVSKAASALGKKGGEAAAKAKKEAAKEAKAAETKEAKEKAEQAEKDKSSDPRVSARARVEQATREAAEARKALQEETRRRQEVEDRIRSIEARLGGGSKQSGQPEGRPGPSASFPDDPGDPRPKSEDFETYEDFVEARARWASRQEYGQIAKKQEAERYARRVLEDMMQFGDDVKKQIDKAREAIPDLVERTDPRLWNLMPSKTLAPGSRPTPLNVIADGLLQAQEGSPEGFGAMMLHFTEHPEEVAGLIRLGQERGPIAILQSMARMESRITPAGQPHPIQAAVSRAKPPIRPVHGSASVVEEGSDDESFEAFVARENAAEQRRRRSGR